MVAARSRSTTFPWPSPPSVLFAAVVAAATVALLADVASAGWKTPVTSRYSYPITDSFLNVYADPNGWSITFAHTDAYFTDKLQSGPYLQNSCRGDPENLYGWEYWRKSIIGSVFITSQNAIRVTFAPVRGFTVVKPETVRCGPFTDEDGKPLYVGKPLTGDDAYLTFQIKPFAGNPAIDVQRKVGSSYISPISKPFHEKEFRRDGIEIHLVLRNDVWNATFLSEIITGLACRPEELSPVPDELNCFKGLVEPRHFSISPDAPNIIVLNVTREESRKFNIFPIVDPKQLRTQIVYTLPLNSNGGRKYTTKGLPITIGGLSTIFTVGVNTKIPKVFLIWRYLAPPSNLDPFASTVVAENQQINMTEDCLRGKDLTAACPRTILFQAPRDDLNNVVIFTTDSQYGTEDVRRYGIQSQVQNFSNYDWLFFAGRGDSPYNHYQFRMKAVPQYETWEADTMTVMPPFTTNEILEPFVNALGPMTVKVLPSPGTVSLLARTVTDREIAEGGIVFDVVMDGESFTQAALDGFVGLMVSPNISDAWMTYRSNCVLPPGSITFAKTPWGTTNYSHIVLQFQRCEDYETTYRDRVDILVTTTHTRSQLTLTNASVMSFEIAKAPGAALFPNGTAFDENDVRAGLGNFTFDIRLASERWPSEPARVQNCFDRICDTWTTSAVPNPSRGIDMQSWANATVRSITCKSNVSDPANSTFVRLSDRLVRFTARPNADYDVRKGERILISVPDFCTASGEKAPAGNATLNIAPQAGFVDFKLCTNSAGDGEVVTEISEHAVRAGGFNLCIVSRQDNFEDDPLFATEFTAQMYAALISNGTEAFGFNNKKSLLVGTPTISSNTIRFPFRGDTTFDIADNETLLFNVSNTWMASGAAPTPDLLALRVFVSAGTVNVTRWFGSDGRNVTEDDVRWGRVWFEFSLLGDQWRRERSPYTQIWSGDLPDATTDTFSTAVGKLIPEMAFFTFTVQLTGHEVLRLRLQANEVFDLPRLETVTVSFPGTAVASGVAPLFQPPGQSGLAERVPSWVFQVHAVPGRVILSGATSNLNEKLVRRSDSVSWFLTLIGETWRPNASNFLSATNAITSYNSEADPSNAVAGFERLKDTLLPPSSISIVTPRTMRLDLRPNRFFEIVIPEVIRFVIGSQLTLSGLAPTTSRPLEAAIVPTGGELRLANTIAVTEEDVRTGNFSVELAVDGDQWDLIAIQNNLHSFVRDGFSSQSPVIREPNGFLRNRDEMLRLNSIPVLTQNFQADASTIAIYMFPSPSFDIDADETITFSVSDRAYVMSPTGDLPDPAVVSFTILSVSRTLVAIIDPNLPYTSTFESQPRTFESVVASLMSLSVSRVQVDTAVGRRERDQLLVLKFKFVGSATDADPRTASELASTMLSLNSGFLNAQIGSRYLYFEDSPPSEADLYPQSAAPVDTAPVLTTSMVQLIIWLCSAVVFTILVAIGFVVFMRLQRRHLAVGLTKSDAVENRGEDQGVFSFEDTGAKSREQEAMAMSRIQRMKEKCARLRNEGNAAEALRIERNGYVETQHEDDGDDHDPAAKINRSNSTDSGGMASLGPGAGSVVVGKMSDGRPVHAPMSMKEYVRRTRFNDDGGSLTIHDVNPMRQEVGDDDDIPGEYRPEPEQAKLAKARGMEVRDPLAVDSAPTTVSGLRLRESGLPKARMNTANEEGALTEADLEDYRRRKSTGQVRRRKAAVDALVDF